MTTLMSRALVGIILSGATGIAAAGDETLPWEQGSISISGFLTTSDSELRFETSSGVGVTFDPADVLGLESDVDTFRLDGLWRFGSTRRHQLEVHYYNIDREGSRALGQNLRIVDVLFPEGLVVNSRLELEALNVDYGYAFLQDDRVRVAATVGMHVEKRDFEISSLSRNLAESESFTAPLPTLGLRGDFVLTPHWRLKSSLDALYFDIENTKGTLVDALLAVEYLPFDNVGIGAGFNSVRLSVESEGSDALVDVGGKTRLSHQAALLYLKLFF